MAFEWSYENQNLSYQGKFQWIFDQGKENWIWVGEKFELSEFELTEKKRQKSGCNPKVIGLSSI